MVNWLEQFTSEDSEKSIYAKWFLHSAFTEHSLVGKESTCNAGDSGSIPGLWRLLEKGKAAHYSILAWIIPWTLQSMGSQRVGQDWVTFTIIWKIILGVGNIAVDKRKSQDGWLASPTQWTWVWTSSGRGWRTGKPGVLQPCGCKESDTTERLNNNKTEIPTLNREW